ncbi:ABC transporter substrate-binding protein [Sulfurimonas sp.]|uniref:ABC transporter substrate-binding protein n=1 Tax=Sulfurimonas sp. TaxID=2022749 RepID=UPI0025EB1D04|nr:ABC transporter substrate-binding protein [Sulfurimonas sp.]
MKKFIHMGLLSILFIISSLQADARVDKIVIAGPFASVSHPLLHMIQTQALKDVAKEVEFRLWKNPDELRAIVIKGDVDFVAIPTNTAAILNNKGVDIQLLNVSTWGILGMISRDPNLKTLKDFKGKKIAVPFRADMPDIVFKQLLKKQGLDPKKDFELVYVSSPIDAMQMLILRRIDHSLLAEPAISVALRKTKSFPVSVIAPDLYRSVDLQDEWARVFNTDNSIPQAGMAVLGRMSNKKVIARFMEEYDKSLAWYMSHPQEAGVLVANKIDLLSEEGVADSIAHINMKSITAVDAKEKMEFFFNVLKEEDPKSIGGQLPQDSFYYKAK